MGATVTRNGKTYYKGDDGEPYPDYNAARVAAEDRRNAESLQRLQDSVNFLLAPGPEARQALRARSAARGAAPRSGLLASPTNLNEGMTGKNWPAGVPLPGSKPDPRTWAPVLSDDADARASEARRMLQQATPYWEREENQAIRAAAAEGGGPRAGKAGYAQRADIQAWMDAQRAKGPAGQAMVDRFLEQQKKRGLLEAPQPTPMVDQLATSQDAREAAAKGYQGQKLDQAMMAGAEAIEGSAPAADARFEDPNFGTEALRGMPVSPVDSVVGDASARAAALSGYQQAPTTEAFAGASALPNMAFAGNGMTPDQSLQVDREQGVPGITTPISAPEETREMNLGGENALVRRYLNAIQGK